MSGPAIVGPPTPIEQAARRQAIANSPSYLDSAVVGVRDGCCRRVQGGHLMREFRVNDRL